MVQKEEVIEVPSVGGRKSRTLSRQTLAEIIEPRVEEILILIQGEIVRSGYGNLIGSGIILTGGTAIMEGMPEIAEQIFNLPVRRGYPVGISGLADLVNSPIYATGVGLVMYGSRNRTKSRFRIGDTNIFSKVSRRMKDWLGEFF
jgi:cell division protein FtsA